MKKYKIDATPPLRSTLKYYDNDAKELVKYDADQYAKFVESRGTFIRKNLQALLKNFDAYKKDRIASIKKTKYAGGIMAVPNDQAAERIFNEITLPQYIESIKKAANEKAKFDVKPGKKTKKDIEVIDILKEFENYINQSK